MGTCVHAYQCAGSHAPVYAGICQCLLVCAIEARGEMEKTTDMHACCSGSTKATILIVLCKATCHYLSDTSRSVERIHVIDVIAS